MPQALTLFKINWISIGKIKICDFKATLDTSVTIKGSELSTGTYQETEVKTHDTQTTQVT